MTSALNAFPQSGAASLPIHVVNSYTNSLLGAMESSMGLSPVQMRSVILESHAEVVNELARGGVNYGDLRQALTPTKGRREVAFIFDSTGAESYSYGYEISEAWLPALRAVGPRKSAIRHGDILQLPREFVWNQLATHAKCSRAIPRLATEQYYIVYFTNLSENQVVRMAREIHARTPLFIGYLDCTTWTALKSGMFLPQFGIRLGDVMITDMDDGGTPNQVGYPAEDHDYRVLGIDDSLYGVLLTHRLDNGVPEWADKDSAMALNVLGGAGLPVSLSRLRITPERLHYLIGGHGGSLNSAGLVGLSEHALVRAIEAKVAHGAIFNLRFIEGSRAGVVDPSLDALMFSASVEFLGPTGNIGRYIVGLKFTPERHEAEIVTFV